MTANGGDASGLHGGLTSSMVGALVVGASMGVAFLLCTGLCLALWYRRLRGNAGEPSPATFLVSKQKSGQFAASGNPMSLVMPTITCSEGGSEPHTPTPTLVTPTERNKTLLRSPVMGTKKLHDENIQLPQKWETGLQTTFTSCAPTASQMPSFVHFPQCLPPTTSSPHPSPCFCPHTLSSRPPKSPSSPRLPLPRTYLASSRSPSHLTLPVGGNKGQHHSRSGSPLTFLGSPVSPPPLPPRSIFMKKGVRGLDDLRAAIQQSVMALDLPKSPSSPDVISSPDIMSSPDINTPDSISSPDIITSSDVMTPDSIDGWGPSWTPVSSIGSGGGGCGLGELRVRLRYSVRTRLLRLTVVSADNLPLRLGPDPVNTYTKAVLLPEKRVRFTTSAVPATINASFNAVFTHAARPTRLAHTTLRLSVCQVMRCGRRVVVGYAALPMWSAGIRSGLCHDLDSGLLTLPLHDTAPDQQVGAGGGQLQVGLGWDSDNLELTISILHLTGLHSDPGLQGTVEVYVKVTVYMNNTILCWRRTPPTPLHPSVTTLQQDLVLTVPDLDLDATHLVLSARERTGPGCGRRVLGSCLVGRGGCVPEEGRHHWLDMLRAAPDTIVRTHQLAADSIYQSSPFSSYAIHEDLPSTQEDHIITPISQRYQEPQRHPDDVTTTQVVPNSQLRDLKRQCPSTKDQFSKTSQAEESPQYVNSSVFTANENNNTDLHFGTKFQSFPSNQQVTSESQQITNSHNKSGSHGSSDHENGKDLSLIIDKHLTPIDKHLTPIDKHLTPNLHPSGYTSLTGDQQALKDQDITKKRFTTDKHLTSINTI